MKTALITGIRGQDAAYLSKLLLQKDYRVLGSDRRSGGSSRWRLETLGIESDVEYITMDLLEITNILQVFSEYHIDEVYNLAAQSFVSDSFKVPLHTVDVNLLGTYRLLEAIKIVDRKIKFYQASTSEMFGKVVETPQRETTSFYPRSPYGVAKLAAHWATINYRESYDIFACCGILFNHESELRGEEFVTRKITSSIKKIYEGSLDTLKVGNLDAKRDWGHAEDYVRAMWLMLQQDKPDDYVISTGENHTVKEFINTAFEVAGTKLRWYGTAGNEFATNRDDVVVVTVSPDFYRPCEVETLLGDSSKAREKLGWRPEVSFNELVQRMVVNEFKKRS